MGYSVGLVAKYERIAELRLARSRLIKLLTSTLELDLKLLHSTEADPTVIARHHGEFADFIDVLSRHVQHPHVQQYSEMNQEEFLRAEHDFLNQYMGELNAKNGALRELLLIRSSPYMPAHSLDELVDRMEEARRSGRPNQFTESQRTTIQRLQDPAQYYGKRIAEAYFRDTSATSNAAGSGGDAESDTAPEDAPDETERALLRMKAQVITDRLATYGGTRKSVLVTSLLKVKNWMAEEGSSVLEPTGGGLDGALARGTSRPAVELISAQPRDLVFVYHGSAGNKAVFHCGVSNATLHKVSRDSDLPLLTGPAASVLLFGRKGSILGSAYVTCTNAGADAIDELALLIKSLDFTSEFMKLARSSEAVAAASAEAAKADAELLDLAEEL